MTPTAIDTAFPAAEPVSGFYVTGGTLGAEAACYVERRADRDLLGGLTSGEFCYVLNSRQMGKSSLCVRTMARLHEMGWRTCFLDLTKFGGKNLSAEQWYAALLSEAGRALGLRAEMLAHWKQNTDLAPMQRLFGAIQTVALSADSSPLAVFVDEIDVTRGLPFSADEFFAGVRQSYVGRATDLALNKLTVCLLGTATPADLIQDTRTSPFNIGRRIEVRDFTAEEAQPLAAGLGTNGPALLSRVLYWTGGHPYLTQRLCRAAQEAGAKDTATIDRLCSDLFLTRTAADADDNLAFVRNRLLKSEVDLAGLLNLYGQMRRGRRVPDDEADPLCAVLKLSGVARAEGGLLSVRNRIYEHVFSGAWITEHTPGAELRRQREAYRRGLMRAGAAAACVVLVMALLAASALHQTRIANENAHRLKSVLRDALAAKAEVLGEKAESDRNLYAADMGQIQTAWENNSVGQVVELLRETQQPQYRPYRGFEWGYWNRLCHRDLLTLTGHKGYVWDAAFSPDGTRIVTAGADRTAKVWDARTGRLLLTLTGHRLDVQSAAFSPDGSRIVTGSWDHTARVWDAQTGRLMLTLTGHRHTVYSVALSPNGRRIVTAGEDSTAIVWDAGTGRPLLTLKGHGSDVFSAVFSPDGRRIVTASADHTARVWDSTSGRGLLTLKGGRVTNDFNSACFSPDGQRIVTTGTNARIWDARTGRLLLTLRGHTGIVSSAAFSPNGKRIVTAGWDGTVRVWDATSGKQLLILKGHRSDVSSAAFSPDGTRIVTASWDSTAKVWDAHAGSGPLVLKGHAGAVSCATFSPDGGRIVTSDADGTTKIWDATQGRELRTLAADKGFVSSAFSPDGRRIVTVGEDSTRIWEAETGRELLTIKTHSDSVNRASFSPDGTRIVTAGQDGTARVWDAMNGKQLLTLKGHHINVLSASFSPDGRRIVTASQDRTAKVWDGRTGRLLLTLAGHTIAVFSAAFSPDGSRIVTGSLDNTARVWDATSGKQMLTLTGSAGIFTAEYSPDGKRIVTANEDGTAHIWDAGTGRRQLTLIGHTAAVNSAAFSPDGRRIVTASSDGTAKVWETDYKDQP